MLRNTGHARTLKDWYVTNPSILTLWSLGSELTNHLVGCETEIIGIFEGTNVISYKSQGCSSRFMKGNVAEGRGNT